MWFVFSVICILGWGLADLFYKQGSASNDRYSHLKIAVWVGLVMGVCSVCLLPFCESSFSADTFFRNLIAYLPASLGYILSMVIGYAGMRYLEISIVSPVQNASGALSALCILCWFLLTGRGQSIADVLSSPVLIALFLIVSGVIALAVTEQRLSRNEKKLAPEEKKYRFGALALIFPLLYCVFDTLGTAADGIILSEEGGLDLGEIDVLVLYGLTFLLFGIAAFIFLRIKTGTYYNPFRKSERSKGIAALCEEFGQVFYVYAMARQPILAAPLVASYCILSVLLSRIFMKEKLTKAQYLCVLPVLIGIVLLGLFDSGE